MWSLTTGIKLDTNNKKITGKPATTWKLNNTFEIMFEDSKGK